MTKPNGLPEFQARYTETPSGCWIWVDRKDRDGYGRFAFRNRESLAHRVIFLLNGIEIPKGMEVDHLCRVRACVNPLHLEVVTPRVNALRSYSASGMNARKTKCVKGHAFTPENTRATRHGRICRACTRARAKSNQEDPA